MAEAKQKQINYFVSDLVGEYAAAWYIYIKFN